MTEEELLKRFAAYESKIYYLQRQVDAMGNKIDVLLNHLNLKVEYQTRWWVTRKRGFFK